MLTRRAVLIRLSTFQEVYKRNEPKFDLKAKQDGYITAFQHCYALVRFGGEGCFAMFANATNVEGGFLKACGNSAFPMSSSQT